MGLGRWCWVRYQGKGDIVLRVVSAYCPCAPERTADGQNTSKDKSVYIQHQKRFNELNDDRCPRVAFLADFETELEKWLEAGDQVVVGGDWNHHILDDPIKSLFERHGMHNMVFE